MTEALPGPPAGSMSGMRTAPVHVSTFSVPGGATYRVEDYGPGRVWVQDLGSPTGMGWWANREDINAG